MSEQGLVSQDSYRLDAMVAHATFLSSKSPNLCQGHKMKWRWGFKTRRTWEIGWFVTDISDVGLVCDRRTPLVLSLKTNNTLQNCLEFWKM